MACQIRIGSSPGVVGLAIIKQLVRRFPRRSTYFVERDPKSGEETMSVAASQRCPSPRLTHPQLTQLRTGSCRSGCSPSLARYDPCSDGRMRDYIILLSRLGPGCAPTEGDFRTRGIRRVISLFRKSESSWLVTASTRRHWRTPRQGPAAPDPPTSALGSADPTD